MKVCPTDPRVIRTRGLLREALMQLVAKKSFTSLTIEEVTRLAGLNRTTFYLHYSGLHELLEDCARTLFDQMQADIYAKQPLSAPPDTTRLTPYVESVFHHLEQHEKFYRAMLGRQGDPLFRGLFQELLVELILEPAAGNVPSQDPGHQTEMILRFFSAGFTEIATWWLENDKPISSQQASLQITRHILPDYLRLIGRA